MPPRALLRFASAFSVTAPPYDWSFSVSMNCVAMSTVPPETVRFPISCPSSDPTSPRNVVAALVIVRSSFVADSTMSENVTEVVPFTVVAPATSTRSLKTTVSPEIVPESVEGPPYVTAPNAATLCVVTLAPVALKSDNAMLPPTSPESVTDPAPASSESAASLPETAESTTPVITMSSPATRPAVRIVVSRATAAEPLIVIAPPSRLVISPPSPVKPLYV